MVTDPRPETGNVFSPHRIGSHRERTDSFEFGRHCIEIKMFLRQFVQIAEMLNDEDTRFQQNRMHRPAPFARIIDIM